MLRSTGLLILVSLLSQALSLALQVVLAHRFGAGIEVDAYVAALTLPGLVESFLLAAAMQLLLPILVSRLAKGERQEAWRVLATLVTVLGGGLLLVSVPVAVARGPLVALLAPGLALPVRALAASFLAALFPGIALGVVGSLLTQAFHAERRFAYPAAFGALSQVIPLAAVLSFSGKIGLWSLIAGTLAAKLVVLVPLAWALARRGMPMRARLALDHPDVRRMVWLALPAMAAVASARMNGAVDRFFVSFLGPGRLASLGYADRVVSLVLAVLVSPVSSVFYPTLAGYEARGDRAGLFARIDRALRAVIAGTIPVAVAMATLAAPTLAIFFERGRFSAMDTERVSGVLACYAGIVVLGGVGSLLVRGFYAIGNTRDPMIWGGLVPIAFNALMDALVFRRLDVYGVAAVTSLNAIAGLPVLYLVLRRRLGAAPQPGWMSFFARACAAGGTMIAVMVVAAEKIVARDTGRGTLELALAAVLGFATYGVVALLLRLDPIPSITARMRSALHARRPVFTGETR